MADKKPKAHNPKPAKGKAKQQSKAGSTDRVSAQQADTPTLFDLIDESKAG